MTEKVFLTLLKTLHEKGDELTYSLFLFEANTPERIMMKFSTYLNESNTFIIDHDEKHLIVTSSENHVFKFSIQNHAPTYEHLDSNGILQSTGLLINVYVKSLFGVISNNWSPPPNLEYSQKKHLHEPDIPSEVEFYELLDILKKNEGKRAEFEINFFNCSSDEIKKYLIEKTQSQRPQITTLEFVARISNQKDSFELYHAGSKRTLSIFYNKVSNTPHLFGFFPEIGEKFMLDLKLYIYET